MNGAGSPETHKRAYRRQEVCAVFGASLSTVDKAIREGRIRVKREGRGVYLAAQDVERLFNPAAPAEIRPEDVADLCGLLS